VKAKGKVYLVGAGPGDPGLITAKALRLLSECDAVVYDRLVPLELVVPLPRRIERHFVGKRAGRHPIPQDKINSLLVQLAHQGKMVVRLKGGDPFIFGRGGEEALHLRKNSIPYEVVPGVTAGIAAPAYAGIPVTFRGKAVYTIFLTAHEAADKDEPQVPWTWLAQSRQGTIVGYMGVNQLPQVVTELIDGGYAPQTPAAIISRGTSGLQQVCQGDLEDLPHLAEENDIKPPAVFVIGEVAALRPGLKWFEAGILFGKKVMVTRPGDQAGEMYALLRQHGAEVLPMPTIETAAHDASQAWHELGKILGAGHTAKTAQTERWIVFTSENGVRYFLRLLIEKGHDLRALGQFRIAAVGAGTARELVKHELLADFVPGKATTATLAEELASQISGQKSLIVRVRGNLGDDRVERTLAAAGAEVFPLMVYETMTASWDEGMWSLLEELPPDIIAFTSGSTVSGFAEILGAEKARQIASAATIACIGPSTTQVAHEHDIRVDIEATDHSVPDLVQAILQHFAESRKK
jgi:uroporphyrinogen III methyltransferase/synthase